MRTCGAAREAVSRSCLKGSSAERGRHINHKGARKRKRQRGDEEEEEEEDGEGGRGGGGTRWVAERLLLPGTTISLSPLLAGDAAGAPADLQPGATWQLVQAASGGWGGGRWVTNHTRPPPPPIKIKNKNAQPNGRHANDG